MNQLSKIEQIYKSAIDEVLPDSSVKEILEQLDNKSVFNDKNNIHVISIGKAAWRMTNSCVQWLESKYKSLYIGGICITKYKHSEGPINKIEIFEAGHPILDENSIKATEHAIKYAQKLDKNDTLIFLVSGGGSALFESPTISLEKLTKINEDLLASGASIEQINKKRSELSKVKGGKFAEICKPAQIYNIILSDVLGDNLLSIASGPTINNNAKSFICGNLSKLTQAAKIECENLGYKTKIITESMTGYAKDEAKWFANIALKLSESKEKQAIIAGGETVVKLKGSGKGGRNQEFALASSQYIKDKNITIFSIGSDGTDGPTDAAGGYASGNSIDLYKNANIDIHEYLDNNDSYNALKATNQLIVTGPTGTNVNDIAVALIN